MWLLLKVPAMAVCVSEMSSFLPALRDCPRLEDLSLEGNAVLDEDNLRSALCPFPSVKLPSSCIHLPLCCSRFTCLYYMYHAHLLRYPCHLLCPLVLCFCTLCYLCMYPCHLFVPLSCTFVHFVICSCTFLICLYVPISSEEKT